MKYVFLKYNIFCLYLKLINYIFVCNYVMASESLTTINAMVHFIHAAHYHKKGYIILETSYGFIFKENISIMFRTWKIHTFHNLASKPLHSIELHMRFFPQRCQSKPLCKHLCFKVPIFFLVPEIRSIYL